MNVLFCNFPWLLGNRYGVRAGSRWAHTIEKGGRIKYFPFPFWLAYSTSILRNEGIKVNLKDCVAEEIGKKELFSEINKFKPDLIVAEVSTPSFENDLVIAKEIKEEFGCEICFTGSHVSALPKEAIRESFVDYVCIGEYEYTIKELVLALEKGKTLKNIKGLGYKEGKRIHINERRELIQDLNKLPFPAREFLPMKKYNDLFCKYFPNIPMISSRGCPFNCSFCLEAVFYGRPNYRFRNAKNVVDEMEDIINNYHAKEIYFDDATFTIGEERVNHICDEILRRKIDIPWSCMGHASVTRETLKKMKQAGCRAIKIGVESSSEQILRNANKSVNLDLVKKCVKNCKDIGLEVHATYMIGLPGETKESIKRTLQFALSLKTDTCQFSIATPFPGTPFYELVKNKGWLISRKWEEFDGNFNVVVEYPNLKKEEILFGFQYCKRKYFLSKLRDFRFILNILRNTYKSEGGLNTIKAIGEGLKEVITAIKQRY